MTNIRMISLGNIEHRDSARLDNLARAAVRKIDSDMHLLPTSKSDIITDFNAGNATFAIDEHRTRRFVGYMGFVPRPGNVKETELGIDTLDMPRMSERYVVVLAQAYRGKGIGPELVCASTPDYLETDDAFDVTITEKGQMVGTLRKASELYAQRYMYMDRYVAFPGIMLPYLHLLETHVDPARYSPEMAARIEGTNPKYKIPVRELRTINDFLAGRSRIPLDDHLTNAMYFLRPDLAFEADRALARHFSSVADLRHQLELIKYTV